MTKAGRGGETSISRITKTEGESVYNDEIFRMFLRTKELNYAKSAFAGIAEQNLNCFCLK
jgi:hypothetical protein